MIALAAFLVGVALAPLPDAGVAPAAVSAISPTPAHIALRRSSPADGDTLAAAPERVALEFNEAVELRVATVVLLAPGETPIALSPLRHEAERRNHLVADIAAPLVAGRYTIRWSIVGRDGHAIRGEVHFTLRADASGLAPPPVVDTVPAGRSTADSVPFAVDEESESGFDATSPAFAAIRWLTFAGLIGLIGVLGFRVGVLARLRRRQAVNANELVAGALSRVTSAGLIAGAVLVAACGLRLLAQVRAVYGEGTFDGASVVALLTGTAWGWGWMLQLVAAGVALGAVAATRRCTPLVAGDAILGVAALALAISAAMSGHPAAAHPVSLAIALDAAHLLAAGGWIGTLLLVALAGIPAALSSAPASRSAAARGVVVTFSSLALACGVALVLTGAGSAWLELRSLRALVASDYGSVLLIKLACVAAALAVGAYNWRVATPRLDEASGIPRLRRSAALELTFAALVLVVTAVLVATPPPADLLHDMPTEIAAPGESRRD